MFQDQYQSNENLLSIVGDYPSSHSQASHFLPSSSTSCLTSNHTLFNAEVTINKNIQTVFIRFIFAGDEQL